MTSKNKKKVKNCLHQQQQLKCKCTCTFTISRWHYTVSVDQNVHHFSR